MGRTGSQFVQTGKLEHYTVVARFAVAALGACPVRERRKPLNIQARRSLTGQAPSAATANKLRHYPIHG